MRNISAQPPQFPARLPQFPGSKTFLNSQPNFPLQSPPIWEAEIFRNNEPYSEKSNLRGRKICEQKETKMIFYRYNNVCPPHTKESLTKGSSDMEIQVGKQSLAFAEAPYIISSASIVGKKESEGPLGNRFDVVGEDDKFGQNTWEEAESTLQKEAFTLAVGRQA